MALALHSVFTADLDTATELGIVDLARKYVDRDLNVTLVHRDVDKPVLAR
ncbi:hypothetical protein [Streptomyces lunalinharesii]|uniref:Uncharacterized protein n=1 Tax=Streptomyces lunalinharesii TaxID=333384 RepID=A0ABN3T9H9_9ACTN